MAKGPTTSDQNTSPEEFPQVPPTDLYATSDIRFVMLEIGKLMTKVDHLVGTVDKHGEKIDAVRHQVSFVKGALYVIGAVITLLGIAVAWYFSGKLAITIKPGP